MRVLQAFLISSLSISFVAEAARPDFWRLRTADEYLSGESEGIAISSRGQLTAAPSMTKAVSFTEPFVLSQVSASDGTSYVGTGNDGNVYRIRGSEKSLLYTTEEPEIYALAIRGGQLFVGSSPHGKIYRVDPATGEGVVFFDPKEAYIWSIEPLSDGSLAVGTGIEGKIWKVTASGEGSVLFDAPETHIRSLAISGARILAGGGSDGRIYEVSSAGEGRALFDSELTEISAIWIDPASKLAWAAGVSSTLPSSAPPKQEPQRPPQAEQTPQQQQAQSSPAPNVDISFSFEQPSTGAGGGSSELYRIEPDGFVAIERKLEREMIYAISSAPDGGILIGTGPLGRIYRWRAGELALLGSVPEKQVVSVATGSRGVSVTTTNSGAFYRLQPGGSGVAEYRSPVKDTGRFSTFGQFTLEGRGLERTTSAFRSGNTSTPDDTWSEWASARGGSGRIGAPPARYLQWKLAIERPAPDLIVDSLSASFLNRNVAPVIESLTVNDPGVVFAGSGSAGSAQVLEATNPDENGIFNTLDVPRASEPGRRMFRKGYRTVTWKASDGNGDPLRYTVEFRPRGSATWLPLRENIEESQINFDTSQVPDGEYEVRVTATDERENPEAPLTDQKEGGELTVDNSSPEFTVRTEGNEIVVTVRDRWSPITRAEYAIDAEKWIRILPADGIADSREEVFRFPKREMSEGFAILRVVDTSWNVGTTTIRP